MASSRSQAPPPLSLETSSRSTRTGRSSSDAIPRTFSADSPQHSNSSTSSLGRNNSTSSNSSDSPSWLHSRSNSDSPSWLHSRSSTAYTTTPHQQYSSTTAGSGSPSGSGTGRRSPPAQQSPTSATPPRRTSGPPVNVYTYCGRHTDQFLFGGKGFGDLFNSIVGKKD